MQSLDVPIDESLHGKSDFNTDFNRDYAKRDPIRRDYNNLQASGRCKLGEFKMNNDTFAYESSLIANEEQKFNPMMNSVFHHKMSRHGGLSAPNLTPAQEVSSIEKQDAKRIYRVSTTISRFEGVCVLNLF